MASKIVSKEEMLERVAVFKQLTPSARPLVDAVLPQFHREIFNVIGRGVTEDATMKVPISAVDGFHLSIIKAGPKKGTGLHNHTTVEVFMPLTGTWAVQWGDNGENELTLRVRERVRTTQPDERGHGEDPPVSWSLFGAVEGDDATAAIDYLLSVGFATFASHDSGGYNVTLDSKGNIVESAKA